MGNLKMITIPYDEAICFGCAGCMNFTCIWSLRPNLIGECYAFRYITNDEV
jgi:hypothetical protein